MAIIPGGCTSKLQPCDVSWNKPFKDFYRELSDEWIYSGHVSLIKAWNRRLPQHMEKQPQNLEFRITPENFHTYYNYNSKKNISLSCLCSGPKRKYLNDRFLLNTKKPVLIEKY